MKLKCLFCVLVLILCISLNALSWAKDNTSTGNNQGNQCQKSQWMSQLTEDQKEQVKTKIKEMKQEGATKEQIRTAVKEMLKAWGIDTGKFKQSGKHKQWMSQLRDEQKEQVKAKIKEMKQEGATKEQIRATVKEMLKGWGIDTGKFEKAGKHKQWMSQLTEEQKDQVKAKIKEMKQGGATKEQIRAAVKEMLQGWGINNKLQ